MKIKALKTFLFLAENGCDFSGHKVLGIPRSNMWAHINELEAEIGIKLINRKRRHSSFTPEGTAFIPYAKKVYETLEEALYQVKAPTSDRVEGTLSISTTQAVGISWLMPSIKDFHAQYPNLRVNIIAEDKISKKMEHTADILLRPVGPLSTHTKHWHISYTHGLFASRSYLKRMKSPEAPDDLLHHYLLGYGEHEFSAFEDVNWHLQGKAWGLPKLTPILTINSTSALIRAAAEGIGICSSPQGADALYGYELHPVLSHIKGPTVKTYFCVKTETSAITRQNIVIFKKYIEDYFKKLKVKINYEEH